MRVPVKILLGILGTALRYVLPLLDKRKKKKERK